MIKDYVHLLRPQKKIKLKDKWLGKVEEIVSTLEDSIKENMKLVKKDIEDCNKKGSEMLKNEICEMYSKDYRSMRSDMDIIKENLESLNRNVADLLSKIGQTS